MSAPHPERILRGAGFSLVGRGKPTPEDRWALAYAYLWKMLR